MKQVVQNFNTGRLSVEEVPDPRVRDGGILVQNVCSLISAGTERMIVELAQKSLLGKARERPDLVRQVVTKMQRDGLWETVRAVRSRLETVLPLGYSCAGEVVDVGEGVAGFVKGDLVACAGAGYASHAEIVAVPQNLSAKLPEGVDCERAAFVTVGAIALQGVRIARVSLGENVAVIGLGLIGQLAVQLLQAAGCRVLGVDISEERAIMARERGAQEALAGGEEEVVAAAAAFSAGRGLDAVLITASTEDSGPVKLAGEIAREKGRVVAVGVVGMDIPRRRYYEKELSFHLSRSYGPGRYDSQYEERGIDYPYGYVRWTEKRNMEAFVDLLARGRIDVRPMITHSFVLEEALDAYGLISGGGESYMGIVLTYPGTNKVRHQSRVELPSARPAAYRSVGTNVSLGLIGAGNFARSVLLPALKNQKRIRLRGIATAGGLSAKTLGERFGFEYCTADADEILSDESIDAVLIATRHDLHASLARAALEAGKSTFVEKPLALSETELRQVAGVLGTSNQLMVGFNRRFAALVREMAVDSTRFEPLAMTYRINAGELPRGSWIQDPQEGGGRIIGEVCHFVDLMVFLCGARPKTVFAQAISAGTGDFECDTLNINLKFQDGSIGHISYFANGDPAYPKERLEVFGGRSIRVLEDFRCLTVTENGRTRKIKRLRQDKGHQAAIQAFLEAVRTGKDSPISPEDLIAVTTTTFLVKESLRTGASVEMPDVQRYLLKSA